MGTHPDTIGGYRIVKPAIGRGGAGVVHEAEAPNGARVAIKVLDRAAIEAKAASRGWPAGASARIYEKQVERFKEEYSILVGLVHPNVAKVIEIGVHEGSLYIAQEFIAGRPIAEHARGSPPLEMVPLFMQALSGLDFIHRNGILHLDIKSGNILVQEDDGPAEVKIIDFGLAMRRDEYGGALLGTASTMAPEVALGRAEDVDARSDLFSMGVVMYQCITWGNQPFMRPPTSDRDAFRREVEREAGLLPHPPSRDHASRPGLVPEFLDTIVMRLIAHDPARRFYGNARAVINALATHMPDAFADTPDARGAYLKPERGAYIGRDPEVALVERGLTELLSGRQPSAALFCIIGAMGLGKTHFLRRIRETADRHVEALLIHSFALPMGAEALDEGVARLSSDLAANARPILVLVDNADDLQRGSKAAQAFEGLARLMSDRRARPEVYAGVKPILAVFASSSSLGWTTAFTPEAIELKAFGAADIEAYLLSTPALLGKMIPAERVAALHRQTGGNPLELVDALAAMDEKGVVFDAAGEIVLAEMPLPPRPPGSTRDRLLASYRTLLPAEREVAELMACWCLKSFLPPLRTEDVIALAKGPPAVQALHSLAQRGLVEHDAESGAHAFFNRDFAPAVIHGEMGEGSECIHDAITRRLELRPKANRDETAIAYHRALGSDRKAALRACISLGRRLLYREGRCRVAIELFERALALAGPSDWKLRAYLLSLLADGFLLADSRSDDRDALKTWLAIAKHCRGERGCSAQWRAVLDLKEIAFYLQDGRHAEAKRLISSLSAALAGRKNTVTYILLINYEARYYYELALRQPKQLMEFLNRAKKLCEESQRLERQIPCFDPSRVKNNSLPLVLRAQGQLSAAAEKLEGQIKAGGLNIFSQATSYAVLADIYRMDRKYNAAVNCATKALVAAEKTRAGSSLFHAHEILANIYHDMDEFEKSIEERNRQLAASVCFDNPATFKQHTSRIWTYAGHCCKEIKNWDKATVYFDAAISEGKEVYYLMSAYQGLGEVFFHRDDFARELELFAKAESLLEGMPSNSITDSHRYRIARLKVDTFLKEGDTASARQLLPTLKRLAEGTEERISEYEELKKRLRLTRS